MNPAFRRLVALLPTAGCMPFGPNLTGRWTGTCTGGAEAAVVLELSDIQARIEGEGTMRLPATDEEPLPPEADLLLDGDRTNRAVVIDVMVDADDRFQGEIVGELRGDSFTGTLEGPDWLASPCRLDLER